MKVLNLYAGIGGNRKLWNDVEVTAVEINPEIAKIYKDFFPNDNVIITDAHQYLLEHFEEYDFIWSSPPCPTHSRARFWGSGNPKRIKPEYFDISLYQEIILLQKYSKKIYCVENVIPYYAPLIPGQICNRHIFWANFWISNIKLPTDDVNRGNRKFWAELKGFDLSNYRINNRKDQIYRNIMNPKLGLHIFNCAFKQSQLQLAI